MKSLLAASVLALLALTTTAGAVRFQSNSVPAADKLFSVQLKPSSAIGYGVVYKGDYFVQAQNSNNKDVTLYAFNAISGASKWNVTVPSNTGLYVAAGGGNIYAGTFNALTAYNPENGAVVWTYTTTPDMHSPNLSPDWPAKPTYLDGVVYVTWYNTPMVALDAQTGSVIYITPYYVGGRIWTDGEESKTGKNTGKNLYFMRQDNITTKYASASAVAANGQLRWNNTWDATGNFDTCVANRHGYASRVFTTTNSAWGKDIIGMDKTTGNILWLVNGTDVTSEGGFDYNIMNDRVCVTYQNSLSTYIIACYDVKNGALQWSVNLPLQDNSGNMAAGDNFVLVYFFNSGKMFAFDYDGNPIWYQEEKQPWYGTLSPAGVYYYGSYDSNGNAMLTAVQNPKAECSSFLSKAVCDDTNGRCQWFSAASICVPGPQ